MITDVNHVSLIVADQQEALKWYTEVLGFKLVFNDPFPMGDIEARWITVAPEGQEGLEIVLQPPEWGLNGTVEERKALIGKMPGFVMGTKDCQKTYESLKERGVKFISEPQPMPWGISAVFEDLYGYQHNIVGPANT